jgi:hypothetical protein
MSSQTVTAQRIAELAALAQQEGITLPWPAPVIVGIEARGGYVDLTTGLVGRSTERVQLTPAGEVAANQS